ncbi:hypothetical protein VNI00_016211 [Paramarasmius palmivorus]|uniref:Uncharacterized protein n=1 Tax=Paramarasmius palmivorus TaxID=297713 RepID=A0AAW0BEK4_9AGAR
MLGPTVSCIRCRKTENKPGAGYAPILPIFNNDTLSSSASGLPANYTIAGDATRTRPPICYDVAMLVLKPVIEAALRRREAITPYLLLKREYLTELLSVVYKKIEINKLSTLQLLCSTMAMKPNLGGYVRHLEVVLLLTTKKHPPYQHGKFRFVPQQVARLLSTTAQSLVALVLVLPVHPWLLYTFRTTSFPLLNRIRTFHNYMFDPSTAIWYQRSLTNWYEQFDGNEHGVGLKLEENQFVDYTWPSLKHVFLDFDCDSPDFTRPTLDCRYLPNIINVGLHLAHHKTWEFNLHNFLAAVMPPSQVSVIAIFWTPDTPPTDNHGVSYRFREDVVLPLQGSTETCASVNAVDFGIFSGISFVDPHPPTSSKFWVKAKEFVLRREVRPTVFCSREYPYLVNFM